MAFVAITMGLGLLFLHTFGVILGLYIGIMENKMETIWGLGFRLRFWGLRFRALGV